MDIQDIMSSADVIKRELNDKATHAATEMLQRTGGDNGACGFAWVTIYPEHKGNTKLGKAERVRSKPWCEEGLDRQGVANLEARRSFRTERSRSGSCC